MTLREVVATVAEGTGLKLWIVNTPVGMQRIAVWLMNAVIAILCLRQLNCRCSSMAFTATRPRPRRTWGLSQRHSRQR